MADVNKVKTSNNYSFFKGGGQLFCKNGSSKCKECFDRFDENRDGYLDKEEFNALLKPLFTKPNDEQYPIEDKILEIYELLGGTQENGLNYECFKVCWEKWIKKIVDPVSALLVIDVQNDFISGSLSIKNCPAKHDGAEVVPVINYMLSKAKFNTVVYSCDWHPKDHISFIENVKKRSIHSTSKVSSDKAATYDTVIFSSPRVMEQKLWPAHCVQNTKGAELHPDLKVVENHVRINKGTNPDIDSYSAFWDNGKLAETALLQELKQRGVTDVYVCGIAYEVCVAWTTQDALDHGLRTILVDDASRGLDEQDIADKKASLKANGALLVKSTEVADLVSGLDRRPELGYFAAKVLAKEIKSSSTVKPSSTGSNTS